MEADPAEVEPHASRECDCAGMSISHGSRVEVTMPNRTWTCCEPSCSVEFERHPSQVRNTERVYCSAACRHRHLHVLNRGPANPNYRGGHTLYSECSCGREKDRRAQSCGVCARVSRPKSGDRALDLDAIAEAVRSSSSLTGAARVAGVSRHAVSIVVKEKGLDLSHMRPARGRRRPAEEILVKGTKRRNQTVRRAVLDEGLIAYECAECGQLPTWRGRELVLPLDHINGDATDNRIHNLRFLCPNCHTQTDTYTGRNIGRTAP